MSKRTVLLVCGWIAFVTLIEYSHASTVYNWRGSPSNSWTDPTAWIPNGVPGCDDIAVIGLDYATVTWDNAPMCAVDGLTIGEGTSGAVVNITFQQNNEGKYTVGYINIPTGGNKMNIGGGDGTLYTGGVLVYGYSVLTIAVPVQFQHVNLVQSGQLNCLQNSSFSALNMSVGTIQLHGDSQINTFGGDFSSLVELSNGVTEIGQAVQIQGLPLGYLTSQEATISVLSGTFGVANWNVGAGVTTIRSQGAAQVVITSLANDVSLPGAATVHLELIGTIAIQEIWNVTVMSVNAPNVPPPTLVTAGLGSNPGNTTISNVVISSATNGLIAFSSTVILQQVAFTTSLSYPTLLSLDSSASSPAYVEIIDSYIPVPIGLTCPTSALAPCTLQEPDEKQVKCAPGPIAMLHGHVLDSIYTSFCNSSSSVINP